MLTNLLRNFEVIANETHFSIQTNENFKFQNKNQFSFFNILHLNIIHKVRRDLKYHQSFITENRFIKI